MVCELPLAHQQYQQCVGASMTLRLTHQQHQQLMLNITRSTGYCRCNGDYSYVYNHNQNQQDKQEKLQEQQKRLQVMLMQGKVVLLWTTFFSMT